MDRFHSHIISHLLFAYYMLEMHVICDVTEEETLPSYTTMFLYYLCMGQGAKKKREGWLSFLGMLLNVTLTHGTRYLTMKNRPIT